MPSARRRIGDRHCLARYRHRGGGSAVPRQGPAAAAIRRHYFSHYHAHSRHRGAAAAGWRHRRPGLRLAAGLSRLRLRIPHHRGLEPGDREVRRAGPGLRHDRHLAHRHADRGAGRPDGGLLPDRALPDVAAPPDRHRHRAARRHPEHHLRHLGPVHIRPVPAADPAAVPDPDFRRYPDPVLGVRRSALRHRHPDRQPDPGHHGAALHHLDLARRVRRGAAGAQGGGLRRRLHHLGGVPLRRAALHARRRDRRRHARPRPRARRDDGGHLRHRQRAQGLRLDPASGHDHLGLDRQRVHRGGRRPLHLLA